MDAPVVIARRAAPSVAHLHTRIPARHPSAAILGEERLGAAVAVARDRLLTAHYLVLGATRLDLATLDGKERVVRRTVVDHDSGLAVLHVEGPPLSTVGTNTEVVPGQPVFLLTSTGDRERRAATGHVVRVGPFEAFWEYMLDRAIMTTVINPGLAGAPLFDLSGRLLGIVSLGLAAVGRYSLAIPVELFLRQREVFEGVRPEGHVPHAWLGFYPQAHEGGVIVSGVVEGGPADRAGLEKGDLVVSVDGEPVTSLRELYHALWRRRAGDAVTLQVLRSAAIHVVEVPSGDREEFFR
jgi:S1-C subfamily serine protease